MTPPTDAKGVHLIEGQFVCYTTNDRDSGLQFGHIKTLSIKTQSKQVYDYQSQKSEMRDFQEVRIVVLITDAHGVPKMQTEWDSTAPNPDSVQWGGNGFGKHVEIDKQCVSGRIHHHADKFLVLT